MFSAMSLATARSLAERQMSEVTQIQKSAPVRQPGGVVKDDVWQTIKVYNSLSVSLTAEETEEAQRRDVNASWALILPWNAEVAEGARAIVDGSSGVVSWRRWLVLSFTQDPNALSIQQRWVCKEVDPWQT